MLGSLKSRIAYRSFLIFQRLGFHITPNHFYQPIPDTAGIPSAVFQKPDPMRGIDLRESAQLQLVETFEKSFGAEYREFPRKPTDDPKQYHLFNGLFDAVDAELLYCFIRQLKPKKIIEIGSGYSTMLAAQAIKKNNDEGFDCALIAIEPYPRPQLVDGFAGLTELITKPVQEVEIEFFEQLQENDILFIDSSHVLKIGSDVQYEFLHILPSVKPGVVVQIHDIFLPYEYPEDWIKRYRWFWNEQYLLQAFLCLNRDFEVRCAAHYLHRQHSTALAAAFPSYTEQLTDPRSFWIQRIAN